MKLTKTSKSLLLTSATLLAFAVWHLDAPAQCATADKKICSESQHSWGNWLSGNSRSAQFHFVDFLELVTRMFPANAAKN